MFAVSKGDLSRPNPSGVLQRALITIVLGALATLAVLAAGLPAHAQDETNSLQSIDPEDGATAVEYALMIALIALVVVAAVTFMGQQTSSKFEDPQLIAGLS